MRILGTGLSAPFFGCQDLLRFLGSLVLAANRTSPLLGCRDLLRFLGRRGGEEKLVVCNGGSHVGAEVVRGGWLVRYIEFQVI